MWSSRKYGQQLREHHNFTGSKSTQNWLIAKVKTGRLLIVEAFFGENLHWKNAPDNTCKDWNIRDNEVPIWGKQIRETILCDRIYFIWFIHSFQLYILNANNNKNFRKKKLCLIFTIWCLSALQFPYFRKLSCIRGRCLSVINRFESWTLQKFHNNRLIYSYEVRIW